MKKLQSQIRLTLLLLPFAAVLPMPALADEACAAFARFVTPQVRVVALEGDVHYDTGHTLQEITAMAMSDPTLKDRMSGKPGAHTLGLTLRKFGSSLKLDLAGAHVGKTGKDCIWPKNATLTVGYDEFTVYIARQYHEGSCNYGAILNHEMGHVEIDREALRHHLDALKSVLDASLEARFPMLVDDSRRKKDPIRLVRSDLKPTLDSLLKEQQLNDERHDSPESYRHTKEACKSW